MPVAVEVAVGGKGPTPATLGVCGVPSCYALCVLCLSLSLFSWCLAPSFRGCPAHWEQLDLLLLTVAKPRKIHPDGIHFYGLRYLDPVLAAYVGESVIIRSDPRDMAEIRVFTGEGFLCRAICPELAGTTISLKDITAARNESGPAVARLPAARHPDRSGGPGRRGRRPARHRRRGQRRLRPAAPLRITRSMRWPASVPRSATSAAQASATPPRAPGRRRMGAQPKVVRQLLRCGNAAALRQGFHALPGRR
jgi:hypothetical protein